MFQLPLPFISFQLFPNLLAFIGSLCFLNGFFEHPAFDYCLQPIGLNLIIKAFFQIGAISTLQHAQIALQLIELVLEVEVGVFGERKGSDGVGS